MILVKICVISHESFTSSNKSNGNTVVRNASHILENGEG